MVTPSISVTRMMRDLVRAFSALTNARVARRTTFGRIFFNLRDN
jgi:hypothetical protein